MGPTAFAGNLDLDELFSQQRVLKYVSKNKAAKLFAHMLQTATNESVSSVACVCVLFHEKLRVCLGGIVSLLCIPSIYFGLLFLFLCAG